MALRASLFAQTEGISKMSKKKDVTSLKLEAGTNVPAGAVLHLTYGQADARRHLLTPVKDWHKDAEDDRRLAFTSTAATYFKTGEEFGIEGDIDRAVQTAAGIGRDPAAKASGNVAPDQAALDKAFDEGKAAGRAELFAEVEAYSKAADAVDAAEDDLEAVKDGEDKDKIAAAEAALTSAKEALAALGEVKP